MMTMPNMILQTMQVLCPNLNMQNMSNIQSPDEMAQFLLNSGRVTQEQVNQARQLWEKPNIRDMVHSKFKF